jgi:UDP-glucose 4-epimerase
MELQVFFRRYYKRFMQNILITGSKGFIGSRLSKNIKAIGIDFRDGHNLITTDLPKSIDIIYHLAAQSSVEASWYDPVHDMDNIRMTARLVKKYPYTKIIYAASAATPTTSPYGFSKWASAEYIKNFHKNYVICTLPNVYGQKGGRSVVDIFKDNDHITIFGDGKQTRSYVHVDDIVVALILAKDWDVGQYYLGDGKPLSVLDIFQMKKNIPSVVYYASARREERESVLENTTPNWKPTIKLKDYINE